MPVRLSGFGLHDEPLYCTLDSLDSPDFSPCERVRSGHETRACDGNYLGCTVLIHAFQANSHAIQWHSQSSKIVTTYCCDIVVLG